MCTEKKYISEKRAKDFTGKNFFSRSSLFFSPFYGSRLYPEDLFLLFFSLS